MMQNLADLGQFRGLKTKNLKSESLIVSAPESELNKQGLSYQKFSYPVISIEGESGREKEGNEGDERKRSNGGNGGGHDGRR